MNSRAMVMAAGLGLRMRPLTDHCPKPLIPVAGIALIDRTLDWLADSGVTDAVANSHYLAPMLEAHLAARRAPKIHISYEEKLLDTGGGIKKALPLLGTAAFFAVNGDILCIDGKTPTLDRLITHWDESEMDALLLLHPVEKAVGYDGRGDFFLNADGSVRRRTKTETAPYVFTGVQRLHPRLFKRTPAAPFSLNLLYDRLLAKGRLKAIVHDGDWLHIGDPAGLKKAEAFLTTRF